MKPEGSFSVIEALRILGLKRYEYNYIAAVMGLIRPSIKGVGRGTRTYLSRVNLYELGIIQRLVSFGIPTRTIKRIVRMRIGPVQPVDPSLIKTVDSLKAAAFRVQARELIINAIWGPTKKGKQQWPRYLERAVSEHEESPEREWPRYLIITPDPDFIFFVAPTWIGLSPLYSLFSSFRQKLNPILILDIAPILEEINAKIESRA